MNEDCTSSTNQLQEPDKVALHCHIPGTCHPSRGSEMMAMMEMERGHGIVGIIT